MHGFGVVCMCMGLVLLVSSSQDRFFMTSDPLQDQLTRQPRGNTQKSLSHDALLDKAKLTGLWRLCLLHCLVCMALTGSLECFCCIVELSSWLDGLGLVYPPVVLGLT